MEIAVTITTCNQIGIETWLDSHTTKVFDEERTIAEINSWIKTIDKSGDITSAKISLHVK